MLLPQGYSSRMEFALWDAQSLLAYLYSLCRVSVSDAETHRILAGSPSVVPNLDAMLTLARGHNIPRPSRDEVVVRGSVTAQTIHRPVGVGVARNGGDEIREVDHWMIPLGLK